MHFVFFFLYNAIHLKLLKKFYLTLRYCENIKNGYCNLICCRKDTNVDGKTRNIAIQLVLQQCCKKRCIEIFSPFLRWLESDLRESEKLFLQVVYVSRQTNYIKEYCLRSNTTVALYEGRSSQLYTQLLQLGKESLKKLQTCTGFEPLTSAIPVQRSTN